MKILVLGGSYFLGKAFVEMTQKEHSITVFNRGTRPLGLPQVQELCGDRHNAQSLASIPGQHFDAVVDFCAYSEGDIAFIFKNLKASFDQYVFISTCDVYERGLKKMLDETAPFERRPFPGEAGDYIRGKVALEEELVALTMENPSVYTSIRPAFIYGPGNYAPREGMYFHWIDHAGEILHPTDATGEFQMVYVKDVAKAILCSLKNKTAAGRAFNLAPLPMITYESFADALEKAETKPFTRVPVTVQTITEQQIPLPFPLTRQESNWYDGSAALELIGTYTSLTDGLKNTRTITLV